MRTHTSRAQWCCCWCWCFTTQTEPELQNAVVHRRSVSNITCPTLANLHSLKTVAKSALRERACFHLQFRDCSSQSLPSADDQLHGFYLATICGITPVRWHSAGFDAAGRTCGGMQLDSSLTCEPYVSYIRVTVDHRDPATTPSPPPCPTLIPSYFCNETLFYHRTALSLYHKNVC